MSMTTNPGLRYADLRSAKKLRSRPSYSQVVPVHQCRATMRAYSAHLARQGYHSCSRAIQGPDEVGAMYRHFPVGHSTVKS